MDNFIDLILNASSYEDFRLGVLKQKETEDFDALVAAEEKAKLDAELALAAEQVAKDLQEFDPTNLSAEMVSALHVTNGMPSWLILQRYSEWKQAGN
jgi:hypothetical protein